MASVQVSNAAERIYATAAPLVFGAAWVAARALGAPPEQLRARVGSLPPANGPLLWFHGASAGEMAAAMKLAALLRGSGYAFTAGYTATNRAGTEYVNRAVPASAGVGSGRTVQSLESESTHSLFSAPVFSQSEAAGLAVRDVVTFAPWDVPRWVARAFERWRPQALFLVETELWPRLIFEACRRSIPVFCVSGRIYERDVLRYRAIRPLAAPMFRRLTGVLAQSAIERDRFVRLGAVPERCVVGGNLKYLTDDGSRLDDGPLRAALGLGADERVLVCGSIHRDETDLLFSALRRVAVDGVRVIIAPRHPSSAEAVVSAARRHAACVWRRTAGPPPAHWRVLVLDTVGELRHAYAMGCVAVIGGGFGDHGGHNPLEPLVAGVPVMFGPHFHHFPSEARTLARVTPEALVRNEQEFGRRLQEWLTDERGRQRILAQQRRALPDGEAIAKQYLTVLSPWLGALVST